LPLAELKAGQVSYEDRMGLKARPYYYSVVTARGGSGNEEIIETVEVKPRPAISVWDARLSGLLDDNKSTEQLVGQEVILPAHPLGTDYLGRDILSRLIYGARTSLFIGIVAPLIFIGFGTIYGAFAGFMGGRVDHWMMRVVDFVIALPFLLFMILFKVMFGLGPGESGVVPMMLALVLLSWPDSARLVRGQVMQLREQAYVDAARLLGGGNGYIIFSHILPNVLGLLLVAFSFAIPSAIFTEAFLSFIGLGVVPPTPSWGSMCNDGIRTMLTHPHELLFPAIFISATVLAFNLLGDGLRDALDERGQTA
jgi:oligopeptide transport system permease protein